MDVLETIAAGVLLATAVAFIFVSVDDRREQEQLMREQLKAQHRILQKLTEIGKDLEYISDGVDNACDNIAELRDARKKGGDGE